jgi:multicomponent Na+:H+ antiporter subunit E
MPAAVSPKLAKRLDRRRVAPVFRSLPDLIAQIGVFNGGTLALSRWRTLAHRMSLGMSRVAGVERLHGAEDRMSDARESGMRAVSLAGFLLAFWLALSGHYTGFLIAIGVASATLCTLIAARMHIADGEGHPIHLVPAAFTYFPWLATEIAKSGWAVTKVILSPHLPISPTMTRVTAGQRTAAGVATYANSITLTPGTITVGVSGDLLTVHALVADGARDLENGRMNARVRRFEGTA